MVEKHINAIIIDDEQNSRELLSTLLNRYCDGIRIIGEAHNVSKGITLINQLNPKLVFLDIELSGGTGFDILEQQKNNTFLTCFVTGYEKYALKAIKFGAFDYLLKPIDIDELKKVISKAKSRLVNQTKNNTITINDAGKYYVLHPEKIIKISALGNYRLIFLNDDKSIITSRNLNYFEEVLPQDMFFRTHKSHIINFKYINHIEKNRTGHITLNDGSIVPLASRRSKEFMNTFKAYSSK